MSRVAVSLDVSAVPPEPRGAGRYVIELAGGLARGPDVSLTCIARVDDGERWRAVAPAAAVAAAVPAPRPLRLAWEQLRLGRSLARLSPDVHHGPHYTMPRRATVPVVVTVHDLTFFDSPGAHERVKVAFFRRAVRAAAARADAIICVSQTTADRLAARCSPRAPVHVVPHGVDHARFRPEAGDADDEVLRQLGARRPYVAFVGTIEPRKNVPLLVRAFGRIALARPDLSLVVAGGQGWGGDDLTAAVEASPHRERILRTGYVDDGAVPALLRGAAAVAYPSVAEGFGLPALEALACGAPLVTTEGTAMAELARGAALLVPAGDESALIDALAAAVDGGAGFDERRRLGLARARSFTWDATVDGHVEVYRSVT